MKTRIQILLLKIKLSSLKSRRRNFLNNIASNYPNEANRVDRIEDLSPEVFSEIDGKIIEVKKLIIKLERRKKSF